MKNLILLSFCIILFGCGNSGGGPAAPANLTGFEMGNIPGSSIQKAVKKNGNGQLVEEGYVLDGKKSGTWTSYHLGEEIIRVKSISNYAAGKKNGLHMEFSNRGQLELHANYLNDVLDGQSLKFKFGTRVEEESNYKNGKLHGTYKMYHGNGKTQKEINYKDGVQHGAFRYYNEEEQMTLEYEYKDGEKVSGGIVKPESKEE